MAEGEQQFEQFVLARTITTQNSVKVKIIFNQHEFQQEKQRKADEIARRRIVRTTAEAQLHVLHSPADD